MQKRVSWWRLPSAIGFLILAVLMAFAIIPLAAIMGLWVCAAGFFAGFREGWRVARGWEVHHRDGTWIYSINRHTGQRRAVRNSRGHAFYALERHWLRAGDVVVYADGEHQVVAFGRTEPN